MSMQLKNKNGTVFFEPTASSTSVLTWVTRFLFVAGTAYVFRDELCIIGRSVLAGANAAVERVGRYCRCEDSGGKRKEGQGGKEGGKDKEEGKKMAATQTEEQVDGTSHSLPQSHSQLQARSQILPSVHT
jgi:hypothetical protein